VAGLRRLGKMVEQEAGDMPIQTSILEHDVLGPLFMKGRQEGEVAILRRQLEKRFGALPGWASEKLVSLPSPELEDLSERVLDAATIEELLR